MTPAALRVAHAQPVVADVLIGVRSLLCRRLNP
jgi:hypothetical protein